RVRIPARSDLQGDGNRNGLYGFAQNLFQQCRISQQARAATVTDNFSSRTTAVDVDEIRTLFFDHLSGHCHSFGIRAENLNSDLMFFGPEFHHLASSTIHAAARHAFDAQEFSYNKTNAALMLYEAAKDRIGNPGHG